MSDARSWTCKRCGLTTSADHTPGDCIAALRKYTNVLADQVAKMVGERVTLWKTILDLKAAAQRPQSVDAFFPVEKMVTLDSWAAFKDDVNKSPGSIPPGTYEYKYGEGPIGEAIKDHVDRIARARQVLAPDGSAPASVTKAPPVGWRRSKHNGILLLVKPCTHRPERVVVQYGEGQNWVVRHTGEIDRDTIPAIPRDGEVWAQNTCPKHHMMTPTGPSTWRISASNVPYGHARVACGCLHPVNFGRG